MHLCSKHGYKFPCQLRTIATTWSIRFLFFNKKEFTKQAAYFLYTEFVYTLLQQIDVDLLQTLARDHPDRELV